MLDSHRPSIYMYNDTDIIDRDVKRQGKTDIENDKDVSLLENLNEYKSVTCKNNNSQRLVLYSSIIIPLATPTELKQTRAQPIAQERILSQTKV